MQTVAENGRVSRMVNTAFDDIIPERHGLVSDTATDTVGDGDQSSVVCSSHCSDVEQKVVGGRWTIISSKYQDFQRRILDY